MKIKHVIALGLCVPSMGYVLMGCASNDFETPVMETTTTDVETSIETTKSKLDELQDRTSYELMEKLSPKANEDSSQNTSTEESLNTQDEESIQNTSVEETFDTYEVTNSHDSLYAYYEDMANEYQNNPPAIISVTKSGTWYRGSGVDTDSLCYFSQGRPLYKDDTIYSCDLKSKEVRTVYESSSTFVYWCFCNNYFYIVEDDNHGLLKKIDKNGNLLQTCEIDSNYYHEDNIMPCSDGNVFFVDRLGQLCWISSDFSNITLLPYPQKTIVHGLTEDIEDFYINGYYNHSIYVTADNCLYKYSIDDMQWTLLVTLHFRTHIQSEPYIGKYRQ